MSSCYVFDSYALLALLEDEPGADLVAGVKELVASLLTGNPEIIAKADAVGIKVLVV